MERFTRLDNMRTRAVAIGLGLLIGSAVAFGQQASKKDPQVKAKEPTVMTVEGKADQVAPDRTRQERNRGFMSRVGHGLRTGAARTAGAIVGLTGWLINSEDDVTPEERERSRRQ